MGAPTRARLERVIGRQAISSWALVVTMASVGCLGTPPELPPPPYDDPVGPKPFTGSSSTSDPDTTAAVTTGGTTTNGPSDSSGVMSTVGSGEVMPGNCCERNPGPGCDDPTVEACVCSIDPTCCEAEWTEACAGLVEPAGCGMCGGSTDDCCQPHEPCGDDAILDCVCGIDAYCCDADWDLLCVAMATECGSSCAVLEGSCCEPTMNFGCEDFGVMRCVCPMNRGCCNNAWDNACVDMAAAECGAECG